MAKRVFDAVPGRKYELVLVRNGLQLVRAEPGKPSTRGPIVYIETDDSGIVVLYGNGGFSNHPYDSEVREGDDNTLYLYAWVVFDLGLATIPVRFRVRIDE